MSVREKINVALDMGFGDPELREILIQVAETAMGWRKTHGHLLVPGSDPFGEHIAAIDALEAGLRSKDCEHEFKVVTKYADGTREKLSEPFVMCVRPGCGYKRNLPVRGE